MPRMPTNIARRNGRASAATAGVALTSRSRPGAANHPAAPSAIDIPAAVRNAW